MNTATNKATETTTPCREVTDTAAFTYQCGCTPKDQTADKCKTHTPDGSKR